MNDYGVRIYAHEAEFAAFFHSNVVAKNDIPIRFC